MSAPPARGRGGVGRGGTPPARGRGASRGVAANTTRGRGRGRGGSNQAAATANSAGGLLQKLRTGSTQRTSDDGTTTAPRGRGTTKRAQSGSSTRSRGNSARALGTPLTTRNTSNSRPSSPAPPSSHRDFMAQMNDKFQALKPKRDIERKKAIQDGFLADPEKKTNLANAITPVGTCTDMCPQFERVERIVQNMVDRAEKIPNTATGRDMPSEERMVKRFRRSAAGYDEQLPSDIRTPETLRKTLDYLLDKVIGGGERLASIHKFVWDRTRGIRNDFSIQQVTKKEDVKIAVECYERIARFHVLSLHQLSNPDNLQEGEHFDAHQEREQLNNTLLSLMYYYDDNRGVIPLPNEPEFRSYCILFEIQALTPDLEDRMQSWPVELLNHHKVQTAFKLHAAAANTIMDQGPLRPLTPFSVAQTNSGKFWTILSSEAVSYIMACVAEMSFSVVRFTALDALWRSGKSSPQGQQARNQDWTLSELQSYLAFDDENETLEFCEALDLAFKNSDNGEQCLDFTALSASALDKTSIPSQQVFSNGIVEEKRYRRTLVAVINGVGVATAIRQGLVVESGIDEDDEHPQEGSGDDQSMFIPEQSVGSIDTSSPPSKSPMNPMAVPFTPSSIFGQTSGPKPLQTSIFGQSFSNGFGSPSQNQTFGASSSPSSLQPSSGPTNDNSKPSSTPVAREELPFSSSLVGLGTSQKPKSPLSEAKSTFPPFASIFGQASRQSESPTTNTQQFMGFSQTPSTQQSNATQSIFGHTQEKSVTEQPAQSISNNIVSVPLLNLQQGAKQVGQAIPATGSAGSGFVFTQPELPKSNHSQKQTAPVAQPTAASLPQTVDAIPIPPFRFTSSTQPSPAPQVPQIETAKPTSESAAPSIFAQPLSSTPEQATPLFPFNKSSSDLSQPPQTPLSSSKVLSLPRFEPSTTPAGTPERPQSNQFNTSSVPDSQVAADAASTYAAQRAPIASGPPSTPSHAPSIPTLPPPPAKRKFTEADRIKLIETASRLILTQPQGLIEYFVSHHVSNILQPLVKDYLQEQQNLVLTRIRNSHLSRKFFAIWKDTTQRNILNKRAKQRRKLLAAAMQAQETKRLRNEAELEAILAATLETKRIQEEQRRLKNRANVGIEDVVAQKRDQQARYEHSQVVGQKRKITSGESPQLSPRPSQRVLPSHKRSRTIGTMSEPSASLRMSTSTNAHVPSTSVFGGSRLSQSFMGRSTSSADLRRPTSQKIDSTKTDYFKLKAMGVDPNTPLIPDTATSLAIRKSHAHEAREALIARSRARPSIFSASTTSKPPSPAMQPISNISYSPTVNASSSSTHIRATISPAAAPPEDDDFLRQLREARESLAQDADWFKLQTVALEREIEQYQELRRSQQSHTSSQHVSPQASTNSLAKVNGYSYYPADPKPGKTLSRTEERIRRTGAHGLANKPIGADYVPIAMSRQSALRLTHDISKGTTPTAKKRARSATNNSQDFPNRSSQSEVAGLSPVSKHTKNIKSFARSEPGFSLTNPSFTTFAAPPDHDDEAEEHHDDSEDDATEDEIQADIDENNYYTRRVVQEDEEDGDTEDNDDEEDADEEDYDNDEEDQIRHNAHHIAHNYASLANIPDEELVDENEEEEDEDDNDTPGTYPQFSRGQSGSSTGWRSQSQSLSQAGPGNTADDALVLSD